ncbi:MAG: 50S ribosomal protein L32 [Bacteroidetes bacterium]|nr:50S ribosomal protein L32 [Bacteroidota bacterium]
MPNPKRKLSKMSARHRRAHFKSAIPGLSTCPKCSHPKLMHRACANCGYYAGRYVIEKSETV